MNATVTMTYTDTNNDENIFIIIDNELLVAQMFVDPDDSCNHQLDGICINGVLDMDSVIYSVE